MDNVRWGIAATGGIARKFAEGLGRLKDADLVAVASRSKARADDFANQFGIAHRHGHYEALAEDNDVEVVYVASPHARHYPDAMLFLEAGKNVLCEKPLALNALQAERMCEFARSRGLFVMEAVWSRFLPAYQALGRLLEEHAIGDPLLVEADFGFRMPVMPAHRLFDLSLGGGALLDLGIYPLQLASLVLGTPDTVKAVAHLGETGVDELTAAVLHHPGGQLATIKASIRAGLSNTARITASDGVITLPAFMHCPDHISVTSADRAQVINAPMDGNGLHYEAIEVQRCLRDGLLESPRIPHSDTLSLAATMDQIRFQIGLKYPDE
jgi:predicted dehydrogenase